MSHSPLLTNWVEGRSLTKTLEPAIGDAVQPVISQLSGVPGLAGSLPIGALTAQIQSLAGDIVANVTRDSRTKVVTNALSAVHGLSILLTPDFVRPGTGSPRTIDIPLIVSPKIQLPGMIGQLTHQINLGTISITVPVITLPEISMYFHGPTYSNDDKDDILIVLDPVSSRFLPSIESVSEKGR
jgi:hypothetical protein